MRSRNVVDRQTVPKLLRFALCAYLLVAAVVSIFRLHGYGPMPTTDFLDGWIICFIAVAVLRGKVARPGLLVLLAVYLAWRVGTGLMDEWVPTRDLLQAYRWALYLIVFAISIGRRWGPAKDLRFLTLGVISAALAKAVLIFIWVGPGQRPGLFVENNYELALFCGLLVTQYRSMTSLHRFVGVTMMGALMALDGSRSGAVSFAVVILYVLWRARTTIATKVVVAIYAIPVIALVPLLVFAQRQRAAGGVRLDRLNFLDVFRFETMNWSAVNWLFGTKPITPLSPYGCGQLSYYQELFSSAHNGTCYSVILHAFVLRVIFDAGLLGLVLAFAVPWVSMRSSRVSTSVAVALLGIAGANSLSVSGLNNPYVALPILLAALVAGNAQRPEDVEQEESARARRSPIATPRTSSSRHTPV